MIDQVKTAFEHFKSISNLKAIKEQHFKEQAKRANDDSITSGLSEHDLWFGEVKYRVAVIFCQSSFEKYDEGFQVSWLLGPTLGGCGSCCNCELIHIPTLVLSCAGSTNYGLYLLLST